MSPCEMFQFALLALVVMLAIILLARYFTMGSVMPSIGLNIPSVRRPQVDQEQQEMRSDEVLARFNEKHDITNKQMEEHVERNRMLFGGDTSCCDSPSDQASIVPISITASPLIEDIHEAPHDVFRGDSVSDSYYSYTKNSYIDELHGMPLN